MFLLVIKNFHTLTVKKTHTIVLASFENEVFLTFLKIIEQESLL